MKSSAFCRIASLLVATGAVTNVAVAGDETSAWFEEVAASAGLDYTYESGATDEYWFPEIMGGGVALLDYDGDGFLDVYFVQSGSLRAKAGENPPNRLFRNKGDGTFEDVTEAAGVGDRGYGMGVACGDYDQDGDIDIYVTNVGPNVMYQNQGNGTFVDVTSELGVGHSGWGTSCAFVDYDGDDDLDLYVVNNLLWSEGLEKERAVCLNYYQEPDYCSPNNYNASAPDVFYRNGGKYGWKDFTKMVGAETKFGNGLGVACGDYNDDGRVDIYVANDATPNVLWSNKPGNTFEDVGLASGCSVNGYGTPEAGMGVQSVDIDNDGDLDLFMTHLRDESNTFYRNQNGFFLDMTNMTGVGDVGLKYTGFGMGFHDFEHDGHLDLYIANGAVQSWKDPFIAEDPYAEPNHLFQGKGGVRVADVGGGGRAQPITATSRGAAFGDYDNDGDVDVLVVDRDAKAKLLRNVGPKAGSWIGLRLLNKKGADAIGARCRVTFGEDSRWRRLDTAYSYLSANDPRVHFGIGGAEKIDELLVVWPDGKRETFGPLEAGAYHELKIGSGKPVAK